VAGRGGARRSEAGRSLVCGRGARTPPRTAGALDRPPIPSSASPSGCVSRLPKAQLHRSLRGLSTRSRARSVETTRVSVMSSEDGGRLARRPKPSSANPSGCVSRLPKAQLHPSLRGLSARSRVRSVETTRVSVNVLRGRRAPRPPTQAIQCQSLRLRKSSPESSVAPQPARSLHSLAGSLGRDDTRFSIKSLPS
jgi:hypothetical protein